MTETEWTQTAGTESQSTHPQVSHASLTLEYPAYIIHRSPSTTHGCPYKLFAGWCSLQELLHSPPYSSAAFIHYFTSFLNAGYHLKLKQVFLTLFFRIFITKVTKSYWVTICQTPKPVPLTMIKEMNNFQYHHLWLQTDLLFPWNLS